MTPPQSCDTLASLLVRISMSARAVGAPPTGRRRRSAVSHSFFFNDTATTEIYTLSLHDALPISHEIDFTQDRRDWEAMSDTERDRKSTRLNSSHVAISYAVFCLKKKKINK